MTVQEFLAKNNMNQKTLAEISGLSRHVINKLVKGTGNFNCATVEKFAKLGIEVPGDKVLSNLEKAKMGANASKYRRKNRSTIKGVKKAELKDFQIYAVKTFGNTIISKKYEVESIVEAFNDLGLRVIVKDFESNGYQGYDTHYVVELVEGSHE